LKDSKTEEQVAFLQAETEKLWQENAGFKSQAVRADQKLESALEETALLREGLLKLHSGNSK
jgi:hypothetical protein